MSNFCKCFTTFTMFCQATSVWLVLMMLHEQRPALVWSMRQVQHRINTQMLGLDCTSAVCVCWSKWPSWGLLSNIYKDLAFFDSFFENVKPFPAIEFRYPREYKKSLYTVSCPEFLKININVFCLISNFSLTNFCLSLHKVLNSK